MLTIASFVLMPVIAVVAGVRIYMYFKDHNPPHFHGQYSGEKESFDLKGNTLKGNIGNKKRKKVRKWAKSNEKFLKEQWDKHNPK